MLHLAKRLATGAGGFTGATQNLEVKGICSGTSKLPVSALARAKGFSSHRKQGTNLGKEAALLRPCREGLHTVDHIADGHHTAFIFQEDALDIALAANHNRRRQSTKASCGTRGSLHSVPWRPARRQRHTYSRGPKTAKPREISRAPICRIMHCMRQLTSRQTSTAS